MLRFHLRWEKEEDKEERRRKKEGKGGKKKLRVGVESHLSVFAAKADDRRFLSSI